MKLYDVAVPELVKRLTPVEVTFVLLILPLVSYEDCIIRRGNSRQFDIANEREIAELINMEYSKTRRLIKSLIDKGVMGKHETGTITSAVSRPSAYRSLSSGQPGWRCASSASG